MKIVFNDLNYKKTVRCFVNKYIPFKNYVSINLFGLIFIREENKEYFTNSVVRHEVIHTEQIREMYYIGFYLLYLVFWLYLLAKYRNFHKAYKSIPFEKEADSNELNPYYLSSRKPFNWKNYA